LGGGGGGESFCDGRMEVYIAPLIYCISRVGSKRSVSHLGHITHRGMALGTLSRLGRPHSHSGSFGVEIYLVFIWI